MECMIILQGFMRLAVFFLLSSLLVACNSFDGSSSISEEKVVDSYVVDAYKGSAFGQQFNNALLAELYNQLGEAKLSVSHFQLLSKQTKTPKVLKRATEIAAKTGQLSAGLQLAKDWVAVSTNDLEARQYLALLLLRNERFNQAAEQLHQIKALVEKEKSVSDEAKLFDQGLRFIGSMLSVESHHEQSLTVFQHYLKVFGDDANNTQQNLILASLAMKAKKYEIVIAAFKNIDNVRTESIPEIVRMKAKALQNLNRNNEAANTLQQYVDNNEASDSTRLELVRLLIVLQKKNAAGAYLEALVTKHPENRDLLKSLIALDIDRSNLEHAKSNIERLKQSSEYQSDADYFTGEILEAEGQIRNALLSYMRVNKGILLKRAKQKILVLNKRIGQLKRVKVNYNKKVAPPTQ